MTKKLVNVSGEPREYSDNGFIYEFSSDAKIPTQVPDEVAKKLLETTQFKEFGRKVSTLDDKKLEEEENAI